jgi:hypothetical protein
MFRLTGLAIVEHRRGDDAAANEYLARLVADVGDSALYQQAEVLAQLGRPLDAVAALERARLIGDSGLIYLRTDPAIDRGGTFTDIVATAADGRQRVEKLLSENPGQYDDAALEGIRRILAEEGGTLGEVRMGTTVATNACSSARASGWRWRSRAASATRLRIGYQARPEIFARHIVLPTMLYETVVEIDERIGADGDGRPPARRRARPRRVQILAREGFDALAIVLMHGWRFTDHEARWPASPASSASRRFRSAMKWRR